MDAHRPVPPRRRREGRDEEEEKEEERRRRRNVRRRGGGVRRAARTRRAGVGVRQTSEQGGCFVALSRSVDARVKMCNLGDAFTSRSRRIVSEGRARLGRRRLGGRRRRSVRTDPSKRRTRRRREIERRERRSRGGWCRADGNRASRADVRASSSPSTDRGEAGCATSAPSPTRESRMVSRRTFARGNACGSRCWMWTRRLDASRSG